MNDSPVDCQNREWTEPQRDPRPPEKTDRRGRRPLQSRTDLDSLPLEGKGDRRTAVDEVFAEQ